MSNSDGTKRLIEALEASMFEIPAEVQVKSDLKHILRKLGIKSAKGGPLTYGVPLKIESLSATLKNVTFDAKHLKLWRRNNAK